MNGEQHKLSVYADDTLLYLTKPKLLSGFKWPADDINIWAFINYLCTLEMFNLIYNINVSIINIRKDLGRYIIL